MECEKTDYTKRAARRAAKGNNRRNKGKGSWSYYKCNKCSYWHLSSGRKNLLKGAIRKKYTKKFQNIKNKLKRMCF